MVPTNGIILLAKPENACATDATGAILREGSQGFIPFQWLGGDTLKQGTQGCLAS